MRIATWNINSVRLRAPLAVKLAETLQPDVLCLQETKCPDDCFPTDTLRHLGFAHLHMAGQKSYNGVAIFSKIPFTDPEVHLRATLNDARHISVRFKDFTLHNVYVPAGGDIPDPEENPKFDHKLRFMDDLTHYFYKNKESSIIVGDLNIAPLEHDVWSHKQLLSVVSHTPVEIEKMNGLIKKGRFIDAVRHFVPHDEKCYTWWSYRNQDWRKSNRGRRLDHIWVTEDLQNRLHSHHIEVDARDWPQPSDHVPVMVELS